MEDTHKFKCLVLYTSQSGIATQKVHQEHLFRLLQGPFASAGPTALRLLTLMRAVAQRTKLGMTSWMVQLR